MDSIQCPICLSSSLPNSFVKCENDHLSCVECFNNMVRNQCVIDDEMNIKKWIERKGGVVCYSCQIPFKEPLHLTPENYEIYKNSVKKFITEEIEKSEVLVSPIQKDLKYIIEEILTMKCKACNTAFLDFDGCLAVTCKSCNSQFCGSGCGYFGKDVHSHLNGCKYVSNIYMSVEDILLIQNKVKKDKITAFLFLKGFDEKYKEELLKALKPHFEYKKNALVESKNTRIVPTVNEINYIPQNRYIENLIEPTYRELLNQHPPRWNNSVAIEIQAGYTENRTTAIAIGTCAGYTERPQKNSNKGCFSQ